jgi:hypothetical protein
MAALPNQLPEVAVRLYEVSSDSASREWVNLDLVRTLGFYVPPGSRAPELRFAGGGALAAVTVTKKVQEIARLLGLTLPAH